MLACQLVLMVAIEAYWVNGGPINGRDLDLVYPSGKQFDPLGLTDDPDMAAELEVKEIRNGHMALLSMYGIRVQAAVTCQGPVEKAASHFVDPFALHRLSLEFAPKYRPSAAMFAAARKSKAAAP